MSVIGVIFAVFGFLISPFGMLAMLIGFVGFLAMPMISVASDWKGPAHAMLWLAKQPISRAAIVVGEHNDLYFKQMTFSSLGVEVIQLDGEDKVFEDPDNALHYWLGVPFALADEAHGVLFDPRHAALGQRKHALDEHDEGEFTATTEEWETFGVELWKPGLFSMPDVHELVDLGKIRKIVDGGERSEYASRVEELYKHSRSPFDDDMSMMKIFYPIIGFFMVFGGLWLMASQLGTPDASSSVGFGSLLLLAPSTRAKRTLGALAVVVPVLLVLGALAVFVSPIIALAVTIALGLGFIAIPALSMLTQFSSAMAGWFSKFFFKLGFMGYQEPVFEWTPSEYRLREFDDLDANSSVNWYAGFGSKLGFTFKPGHDSWGAETVDTDELTSIEARADGGSDAKTRLPDNYVRSTDLSRDTYGAYLPETIDDDSYYLNTGIALNRFSHSAVGEKSLKKLLEAKQEHGQGENPVGDKMVMYMTAAAGLLGFIAGVFFFLL